MRNFNSSVQPGDASRHDRAAHSKGRQIPMSLQLQLQWFHFNSVSPLMCSRVSYEAGGNCIPKENIDHIVNFFFDSAVLSLQMNWPHILY